MYPTDAAIGGLGGSLLVAVLIGGRKYATTLLLIPLCFFMVYGDNGIVTGFLLMATVGMIARVFDGFIYGMQEEYSPEGQADNERRPDF